MEKVLLIASALIALPVMTFCGWSIRQLSHETRPSHCRMAMEAHLLPVKH
jgi:hypothetical protein